MDFFKHTIHEDIWNFYIIEDDDDIVQDESDAAVTEFAKKEVFFRSSYITKVNVRHELFHVYVGYCYLGSATVTHDVFEEIVCELFAYESDKILKLADDIYAKLLKLKDKKVKSGK